MFNLSNLTNPLYLMQMLLRIPIILIALSLHETAHGCIANKLGDPTAKNLGRLSINPIKHLDPIGTICMFLFGFGWAKPVPVNSRYLRHPKRDMALVALAGPVANLLLGVFGFTCVVIVHSFFSNMGTLYTVLLTFFSNFYFLNIYLALFNLLPIPPFDGSRILFIFLPDKLYFQVMKYERIIMLVILVLLWTGYLSLPFQAITNYITIALSWLFSLIPGVSI